MINFIMKNANLHAAKVNKNDEFYTQLSDIEKELKNYREFFKDKIVYCNCDDCFESNFFKYFALNFSFLGLKKLIATCYDSSSVIGTQLSLWDEPIEKVEKKAYKIILSEPITDTDGDGLIDSNDIANIIREKKLATTLDGDGDFRSDECIELLKECDVVVTNPPFSLFREFIATMEKYNKKYVVIGNKNAITYKEIFPLIKDNKLWLGYLSPNNYIRPDGTLANLTGLTRWFTNIPIKKRTEKLIPNLYKKYNETDYPKYDNYDAINVDKVADIPVDYYGVMGVPITFLDKYNPEEFEIVGLGTCRELYTPTKHYENPKKYFKDGRVVSANEINSTLTYAISNKNITNVYYLADNSDKILFQPYARILICNKIKFAK